MQFSILLHRGELQLAFKMNARFILAFIMLFSQ